MDSWDLLKSLYKEHLGIEPIVLDYIATQQILKMAVEGRSTKTIAIALDYDEQYIMQTLFDLLYFNGFSGDLGFNARSLFIRHRYNKYAFMSTARTLDHEVSDFELSESFRINSLFDIVERKISEYDECA